MSDKIPLFVIGLEKDDPANEIFMSKFGRSLEKFQQVLSDILEAKISIKSQNTEGARIHYDVTSTVKNLK